MNTLLHYLLEVKKELLKNGDLCKYQVVNITHEDWYNMKLNYTEFKINSDSMELQMLFDNLGIYTTILYIGIVWFLKIGDGDINKVKNKELEEWEKREIKK